MPNFNAVSYNADNGFSTGYAVKRNPVRIPALSLFHPEATGALLVFRIPFKYNNSTIYEIVYATAYIYRPPTKFTAKQYGDEPTDTNPSEEFPTVYGHIL